MSVLSMVALAVAACGSSSGGGSGVAASTANAGSPPSQSSTGTGGATEQAPFKTVSSGYLTVAFQDGGLPRVAQTSDGDLGGTWGWVITQFADKYGLKLKLTATDTSGEILAVSSGRADIGSAIYDKPARQKVVHFLDQDMYDKYYVAYPKSLNYTGPDSLKGKTVGVAAGFAVIPYLQKYFGSSNVKEFTTYALGIQALKNGQIDAYFNTTPLLGLVGPNNSSIALQALNPGDFTVPGQEVKTPEGPVVKCGNTTLADAYNSFYQSILHSDQYKSVWTDAWTAVGAPDPLAAMVTDTPSPANGC